MYLQDTIGWYNNSSCFIYSPAYLSFSFQIGHSLDTVYSLCSQIASPAFGNIISLHKRNNSLKWTIPAQVLALVLSCKQVQSSFSVVCYFLKGTLLEIFTNFHVLALNFAIFYDLSRATSILSAHCSQFAG